MTPRSIFWPAGRRLPKRRRRDAARRQPAYQMEYFVRDPSPDRRRRPPAAESSHELQWKSGRPAQTTSVPHGRGEGIFTEKILQIENLVIFFTLKGKSKSPAKPGQLSFKDREAVSRDDKIDYCNKKRWRAMGLHADAPSIDGGPGGALMPLQSTLANCRHHTGLFCMIWVSHSGSFR